MSSAVPATSTSPAPQWLRELTTGQTRYAEVLNWPVRVEIERRRLALAAGDIVDAITMPVGLGRRVLAELRIAMLPPPVIAGPSSRWWTFLARPAHVRLDMPAELRDAMVRITPRGAQVLIPIDPDAEGWVERPRRDCLPPWPSVVATTLRLTSQKPPVHR
jgi:hypothetical protein